MNKNNKILTIKDKIGPVLETFFTRYAEVQSAYLFGSLAQGLGKPSSDIDIAIRFIPDQPAEFYFDVKLELMGMVEVATGRKADIVILNQASLNLIHQVLRHGILLHAKDSENESDYAIQKQKAYFDFQYYLNKDRQALKSFYGAV